MQKNTAIILIVVAAIVIAAAGIACGVLLSAPAPYPFPIDVVCTWVDGTDAGWHQVKHERYTRLASRTPPDQLANIAYSAMREPEVLVPGQLDELYYSAHSIVKFMPWVRTYYLVTMRPHKPAWWPASGRVGATKFVLVHHDTIATDARQLPTFNSIVIQTYIPNIPRLNEHFILFDDDFFVGQPLRPQDFFTMGGKPVMRTFPLLIPPDDGVWTQMCINNKQLITSVTGKSSAVIPEHVPTPCLKSAYNRVVRQVGAAMVARSLPFRSTADFVIQYVMTGILNEEGMVVELPADIETQFFHTDKLAHTKDKPLPHLFCVNDRISAKDRLVLAALLEDKSPGKASQAKGRKA